MKVTTDQFREVMGSFATGVTVVTTLSGEGFPYGVTVNSFTSVSLDPFLILVCLDNDLTGMESFLESGRFAINILSEDQQEISTYFAIKGSDRTCYIDGKGDTGVPILSEAMAHLECTLRETFPGGDHTILIGEVQLARVAKDWNKRRPLLFFGGQYCGLAHKD